MKADTGNIVIGGIGTIDAKLYALVDSSVPSTWCGEEYATTYVVAGISGCNTYNVAARIQADPGSAQSIAYKLCQGQSSDVVTSHTSSANNNPINAQGTTDNFGSQTVNASWTYS